MYAVTAASSAKSMSLMVVLRTLAFALSLAILYSLPSDLVCMYTPSVEVLKGMFKKEGEVDAKECRGKDAALLHTVLDVERFGHAALVLNGCLHVIVERSNHTVQIREASDLQEDVEKPMPANQVKCLG